jgi:signal transduction histidine kinase
MIGLIFNIAVNQYIERNAIRQLEQADAMLQTMEQRQPDTPQPVIPGPGRTNNFRIQANMFPVDKLGKIPEGMVISDEVAEIMSSLSGSELKNIKNERIKTENGIYFVSAHYMSDAPMGEDVFWIVYADVTGLSFFANTINIFLIILVCVMFVIAGLATIFLSNTITRPIKKLNSLATNIGHGDFTPNDLMFKDMEFENLNMTLNKAAKQLGAYDAEQKAFFQNASHDLRTPLMSIKCYAEGISVGLMDSKQASGTILQETDRMAEMVTDLLYISKIDNITSSYTETKTDLIEIIRSCAWQQQAIADAKLVRITFDFDENHIYYDCVNELIARAVTNLISNAIRYAKSEITLSCRENDDCTSIRVSDDGAGIEAENMPHIFERFYKGAGGNHGIGLSLVKSIMEQHRGSVSAENMENGGAAFTIKLPLQARR